MRSAFRLLRALVVQLVAACLAWLFVAPLTEPVRWTALAAGLAVTVAWLLRQGWRWSLAHALFWPAVAAAVAAGLPPWLYLLALVLTLAFGRNALFERVPLYRSSFEAVRALAADLPAGARLLEAGSGDGRFALALARARPDLQIRALENAWGSALVAALRWQLAGCPANLRFGCRSFWREDWSRYDIVYVFLSPSPMSEVWNKFRQQAKPGGLLVSNTFEIPGAEPCRRVALSGPLQRALLFWEADHGTD